MGQAQAFQTQLTSMICEGVVTKFPNLKVVMLESGFTWLPPHLWRLPKYWRGRGMEVRGADRDGGENAGAVRTELSPRLQRTRAGGTVPT
mgnify:CR=1 FL=1